MFFVLFSLGTLGYSYENCIAVRKACDFLVCNMHEDGGWSEDTKVGRSFYHICTFFAYLRQYI